MDEKTSSKATTLVAYTPRHELKLFGLFSVGKMFAAVALSFIAILAAGMAIWAYGFFGPRGITEQKAIWGSMQGIEWKYRDKQLATPFLLTIPTAGYTLHLLALSTRNKRFPYLWLELSLQWKLDDSPNQFFMMNIETPLDRPVVSCIAIDKLLARENVTPAATRFLKNSCQR